MWEFQETCIVLTSTRTFFMNANKIFIYLMSKNEIICHVRDKFMIHKSTKIKNSKISKFLFYHSIHKNMMYNLWPKDSTSC